MLYFKIKTESLDAIKLKRERERVRKRERVISVDHLRGIVLIQRGGKECRL